MDLCICGKEIVLPVQLDICGHKICFWCLKLGLKVSNDPVHQILFPKNRSCPVCDEPTRDQYKILDGNRKDLVLWVYSGNNNHWWFYDIELNNCIEKMFQDVLTQTSDQNQMQNVVTINGSEYKIDFNIMMQISKSDPRKMRKISRMIVNSDNIETAIKNKNIQGIGGKKFC